MGSGISLIVEESYSVLTMRDRVLLFSFGVVGTLGVALLHSYAQSITPYLPEYANKVLELSGYIK